MAGQKVLALVDGELAEVEVATGLAELGTDPDSPAPGSAWVLRTLENPAGTLQALVGGLPVVTTEDDNKYEFSYRTQQGHTLRTLLT